METRLSDCLKRDQVLFQIGAMSRNDALALLVKRLEETRGGFDPQEAVQSLREREAVLPTVIAPGVALPHARMDQLAQPLIAVATTREGIVFDADQPPVNLILLVLTPRTDPSSYLRVLAMLSSVLKEVDVPQFVAGASAESVCALFQAGTTGGRDYLTAADVMEAHPVTLQEGDSLSKAIHTLCSHKLLDISVVDEEGDLRGVISMEDLLRQSLPQHLLWMEDLTPILRFEPFAEMIRKDHETKLADILREDYVSVAPDTPAVQLAKTFLLQPVRQIQVLEGRRLAGTVSLSGFIVKLFWA